MPSSPRSLAVTGRYRARLLATRLRLERKAEAAWPTIEGLDSTDWPQRLATALTQSQTEAVRASAGYLTAFLSSELGHRTRGPTLNSRDYVGKSRDGRPLRESLRSPLIGTLGKLKQGEQPSEALRFGLQRATRMVGLDFDHAHRTALLTAIEADDRFEGWQRVTAGTCAACAGRARGVEGGLQFQVHPGCQCVSEPVVRGVSNKYPRPDGAAIFAAKSSDEQDTMVGPEAAEKVRSGEITLADLVATSPIETAEDFLTQKPLSEAT